MRKKYTPGEVELIINEERRKAAMEAQQIGFELGRQAQTELYALSEKPVAKEAKHRLKCPNCSADIHMYCLNYMQAEISDDFKPIPHTKDKQDGLESDRE